MKLDHEVQEGVQLVALSGELDLASVAELRAALGTAGERSPSVVIDVSGVSFIDSTALAALLRANDELSSNGVHLVVACPPGPVLRLLTMTSLERPSDPGSRPPRRTRAGTKRALIGPTAPGVPGEMRERAHWDAAQEADAP